jgi:hypothetical protein
MDLAKAQAATARLRADLHDQFPDEASAPRLEQLDAHLATVDMVIAHLFDEAARR